ncbi:hypothetical protein RRG08_060850 [Elysia crispata]|uniref:VWFC domain-containing protein n=1 Tax=Elysia crispata TaxID=231223 RepID=A0AAE0ZFH7_9GAST|nr:hypothetical protein RRG08_060850 [Elysia crispata]
MEMFFTGSFDRGMCEIQGLYPLDRMSFDRGSITRRYSIGQRWTDRCNNCTCTTSGPMCRGPGNNCMHWYDFSLENWCIEWSEDGCCCEKMGCTVGDTTYELGEQMPYGDGNPCLTCACQVGSTRESCLWQQCGKVELQCQNRTVTYDGCCPTYNCPFGVFCDQIPDPFEETPHHELLNWYGGHLERIPMGSTHNFHFDSWTTYKCKCERGGTAKCELIRFGLPENNH